MPGVAVVTDSTCYLPPGEVARLGLHVVPLHVVIGGREVEETSVTSDEVAAQLRRGTPVTTSRPSPGAFLEAYEKAAAAGASAVVSVHLSAQLSGTVDAARLAARSAPVPTSVVDSRTVGMGLGFAVVAAGEAAAGGAAAEQVAAAASVRAGASSALFYVDTLEFLRRGGRIGAAQALLGSALAVKPLLHVAEGRIQPLEKVRTSARALARLVELAVERAGGRAGDGDAPGSVDLAVHHLAAADRAGQLAGQLREALGERVGQLVVSEVGGVVGAHVGPGLVAVIVAPR